MAGWTITSFGTQAVSGPLFRDQSLLGRSLLCSTVQVTNKSSSQEAYSPRQWTLQNPNGVVETLTPRFLSDKDLEKVDLNPEGFIVGDVCFLGDPAVLPGDYVVIFSESSSSSAKRMAWVNSLP